MEKYLSNPTANATTILTKSNNNKIDTWDFQWIYARLINRMHIIIPNKNLISNIGFNEDATHTKDQSSCFNNQIRYECIFPLKHPTYILPSIEFEYLVNLKKTVPISIKIFNKFKKLGVLFWVKK